MRYLSLDLETTCLQPHPEHILQVSMVVEDTDRPDIGVEDLSHFTCFVNQSPIKGESYALAMNAWILDIISGRNKALNTNKYPIYSTDGWEHLAQDFLEKHFGYEKITVAGKNVAGFDIPFLPKGIRSQFRHKVLDPGPLYFDSSTDNQVPNFELCKVRAGLPKEIKHDAREDAMDVIRLVRIYYKKTKGAISNG